MDRNKLKVLAQKYVDGTATVKEKQLLDQWYDTIHDDEQETVLTAQPETGDDVKQRILNQLNQKLFDKAPQKTGSSFSVKKLSVWLGAAAAVLALAVFAYLWNEHTLTGKTTPADKQLVNVPINRVMHIDLPDGSKVWLSPKSVFRYPKSFTGKTRLVELVEGRAFFDVKHQSSHPFIVKTKNLDVTVYGTSFDVRSYKKEGKTSVSVVTGKVGVTMPANKGDNSVIMLLPKQELTLSAASSQLVRQPANVTDATDWTKTNFIFEQESLGNIFKTLEKVYHAKIIVNDQKLLNEKITITLNNQPLDSTIQTLGYTHHFKYQMANDSTVIIK